VRLPPIPGKAGRHEPAGVYWHPCKVSASAAWPQCGHGSQLLMRPAFCNLPGHYDALRIRYFTPMRIALFEPDIPQNTGTILRLAACLGAEAHIIEPAGFPVSDRAFRRAGMDYLDQVTIRRHTSWETFEDWRRAEGARLVLFTTRGATSYLDHAFAPGDVLLFGRESAGVPDPVHAA